jgi:hypothetical protein
MLSICDKDENSSLSLSSLTQHLHVYPDLQNYDAIIVFITSPVIKIKQHSTEVEVEVEVSQYVLVSGTPLRPMTRFFFFVYFVGKLYFSSSWGALSEERTGL